MDNLLQNVSGVETHSFAHFCLSLAMDEELRSPQNLRLTSQTALIAEGYDQVPSLVEDIDKGVKMDGNRSGMNDALENMDEATRLKELTAGVRDQVELERSVAQQVSASISG